MEPDYIICIIWLQQDMDRIWIHDWISYRNSVSKFADTDYAQLLFWTHSCCIFVNYLEKWSTPNNFCDDDTNFLHSSGTNSSVEMNMIKRDTVSVECQKSQSIRHKTAILPHSPFLPFLHSPLLLSLPPLSFPLQDQGLSYYGECLFRTPSPEWCTGVVVTAL